MLSSSNDCRLGLRVASVEGKGRGVLVRGGILGYVFVVGSSVFAGFQCICWVPVYYQAAKEYTRGEPVLEYRGELLTAAQAKVLSCVSYLLKSPNHV